MFRIEIETDNDAFLEGEAAEVARILAKLAKRIVPLNETDRAGPVFDTNGNLGAPTASTPWTWPRCGWASSARA